MKSRRGVLTTIASLSLVSASGIGSAQPEHANGNGQGSGRSNDNGQGAGQMRYKHHEALVGRGNELNLYGGIRMEYDLKLRAQVRISDDGAATVTGVLTGTATEIPRREYEGFEPDQFEIHETLTHADAEYLPAGTFSAEEAVRVRLLLNGTPTEDTDADAWADEVYLVLPTPGHGSPFFVVIAYAQTALE